MRLSLHTDFSLRILAYLAASEPGWRVTTPHLAAKFRISTNHLHKVVQNLVALGILESKHGRGGGISMAQHPSSIRLGWLVQELEGKGRIVDCSAGPCPLLPGCSLKAALAEAEHAFYQTLDTYTLLDAATDAQMSNVIRFVRQRS